jgi:hypothetical protein
MSHVRYALSQWWTPGIRNNLVAFANSLLTKLCGLTIQCIELVLFLICPGSIYQIAHVE